jgi:hypothetical protein
MLVEEGGGAVLPAVEQNTSVKVYRVYPLVLLVKVGWR